METFLVTSAFHPHDPAWRDSPFLMQIDYRIFPPIDATLNGITAVLLTIGHSFIKRGDIPKHRAMMVTAFVTSCLFLSCYLYYHVHVGSVHFRGQGWSRPVYFSILISHVILAAAVVPLIVITIALGLRSKFETHRRIARWTYPIWMYVSITGVIVYLMLYKLFV